ncbi:MAG: hypothetical protein DHS20C11_18950 [Lysobacteraceae bacterium]|nr:MAG: hypothetical protein DHS20C11_18950 [Xanthomonadaceae bacterium]
MKARYVMLLLAVASVGGILLGMNIERDQASGAEVAEPSTSKREILYWVAPMDPNYRREKPGKSPMGMDLIPVYADNAPPGLIEIEPAIVNNLGVRSERVRRGSLWRKIRATGTVGLDESRISHIHLRAEGWIERLYVSAEGERVAKGDVLFELYSPQIVNAQKEYLQALRRADRALTSAATEKLMALGVDQTQIEQLGEEDKATPTVTFSAEHSGVVMALNIREGMFVRPDVEVMSLSDISRIWVNAAVPQSQAAWVEQGKRADIVFAHLPGKVFSGQVDHVYPYVDDIAQTLTVRIGLDNEQEMLKPNMFANVTIFGGKGDEGFHVPRDSVIRTGSGSRVILSVGEGRFWVADVVTGFESGDRIEILSGLAMTDRVVTSGQFLLDSEAAFAPSAERMNPAPEREEMDHSHD